MTNPKRGEIWTVNFDPAKGREIRKLRPAVVISSDRLGVLPVKLVVPITGWSESYAGKIWIVQIEKTLNNGLDKTSAAETLQTRTVANERFLSRKGVLDNDTLEQIVAALALLIEYS